MAVLVADCPRCDAKSITFDVTQAHHTVTQHGWQFWYEAFCVCRHCRRSTIFVLSENVDGDYAYVHEHGLVAIDASLNRYVDIERFINISDLAAQPPPEYLPPEIEASFNEAAKCLAIGCWNAAGVMFRLCVDLATRSMLPDPKKETEGLNAKVRRDLGLRLPWLFDNGLLPENLRELAECIREDGNDGAHTGMLERPEAMDLLDFTTVLFERIYTEPEKLKLADKRREERRKTEK